MLFSLFLVTIALAKLIYSFAHVYFFSTYFISFVVYKC